MAIVRLNQSLRRLEVAEFEVDNQIVFEYFNRLGKDERDDKLLRAIYIGVLALAEERLSTFLSKTANELGTELESLKMIFDMKQELFYKSTVKGVLAEEDIAAFLSDYFVKRSLKDIAQLTGNEAGALPRNKTGDIVCLVNGDPEKRITIECKFDKSIKLGDIGGKDIFTKKSDTAWSQLLESDANRNSKVSLIVFDVSLIDGGILKSFDNVGYIPGVGFVAVINSQSGDYTNLAIAYMLARDIVENAIAVDLDKDVLSILINRLIRDVSEIVKIKSLVESNIENNKSILEQLEKSILMMEFNQQYFTKFLTDGTLSKEDLLAFYSSEDIKDRFKLVQKEIRDL